MASYGEALRRLRERAGVSQRSLAHTLGISHTLLNRSGSDARIPPDSGEIRRIATVLHLTIDELDELLAMAGFWPGAPLELGPGDPTLHVLAVTLTNPELSDAARSGLRQAVEAMANAIVSASSHSSTEHVPKSHDGVGTSSDRAPPGDAIAH